MGKKIVHYQLKRELDGGKWRPSNMVSLPPCQHRRSGGYSLSARVPFSCFLLRLFPLLQHAPSSRAAVLSYSNVGTSRLQLPLGTYPTCSSVGLPMVCGVNICSTVVSAWAPGATPPPPSLSTVLEGLIVPLCSLPCCAVFLSCLTQILPETPQTPLPSSAVSCSESVLEPSGTDCPARRSPWLCSQRPFLQLPPLPKPCHLSLTQNTKKLLDKLCLLKIYRVTHTLFSNMLWFLHFFSSRLKLMSLTHKRIKSRDSCRDWLGNCDTSGRHIF